MAPVGKIRPSPGACGSVPPVKMMTLRLDAKALESLTGRLDDALRLIEDRFHVRVSSRGDDVTVMASGERADETEERVAELFRQLAGLLARGIALSRDDVRTAVGLFERSPETRLADHFVDSRLRPSPRKIVVPKSANQRRYIESIRENDLVFGIGPAGTGKTYLAVAMAIALLNEKRIQRILLARPAVEAGEKLGFLPGAIAAKVDPYLRPLYDALYDMLEPDRIDRLVEQSGEAKRLYDALFGPNSIREFSPEQNDRAALLTNERERQLLPKRGPRANPQRALPGAEAQKEPQ